MNAQNVALEVRVSNTTAQSLYHKYEFVLLSSLPVTIRMGRMPSFCSSTWKAVTLTTDGSWKRSARIWRAAVSSNLWSVGHLEFG